MATDSNELREVVRQKYGEAARTALAGKGASCCGPAAASWTRLDGRIVGAFIRAKKPERSAP